MGILKDLDKQEYLKYVRDIESAHLSKAFVDMIREIVDVLPSKHIFGEDALILDGVVQAIRVYCDDDLVKEVIYREAKRIPLSGGREDIVNQIGNLYLKIGEIIIQGNSIDQCNLEHSERNDICECFMK